MDRIVRVLQQPLPAMSSDDKPLIEAVISGDKNQFDRLVTKYRDKVYRFLVKKVGDTHAAEDLTQDAFLAAFRQLSSFRHESSFSTWLIGIALNLSRNYLNRDRGRKERLISDEFPTSESSEPNDSALISHTEGQAFAALKDEIHKLPEDLRDALILVAMEGYSYEEVARHVQVPVGTVKSRVWRARETLRGTLKEQGWFL